MATTQTVQMSEQEYREFALGDDNGRWELVRGQLREKPDVSVEHTYAIMNLVEQLLFQLDRNQFRVTSSLARLRVSPETYYVPDVAVVPNAMVQALRENPRTLDAYPDPLPLVVEVWSPSTGGYDLRIKLAGYQQRGDLEIWRLHPYERTLTRWVRQPDGSYAETVQRGGIVALAALPGVFIDLDALFAA
jgi:Uma2 family endonuclease